MEPGLTCATSLGLLRLAASISRASSALIAMRASVSTCLPFSSAWSVTGLCI